MSRDVVFSYGGGLDSTSILVRWLIDPSSRDLPLSALTVIMAQVGDEYPDTYRDIEQVILPMLRTCRVRFVHVGSHQICRFLNVVSVQISVPTFR